MIFGEAREQTGGLNKSCSYSYDMINMIPWYRMVGMKCLISLLFWCYLVLRYWPIVFVAYFLSLLHFTGFQYGGNIITSFFLSATRSLFKDSYWKKGKSAGHAKNYGFVLNRISRGYWFSGWWFGTCFIHPYIGISLKDGILAVLAWWYVAGRSRHGTSSNFPIRAAALRIRSFSCQSQMARLSEGDLAPPYSIYNIKITQHSFESMQFSSISPGWLYGVNRLGKRCLSAHQWFSSLFWPLLGFQRSWCFFPTFHLRLSSYFPPQDLAASANGASGLYTDT